MNTTLETAAQKRNALIEAYQEFEKVVLKTLGNKANVMCNITFVPREIIPEDMVQSNLMQISPKQIYQVSAAKNKFSGLFLTTKS
jgi:hypothetical protein